MRIDYYLGVPNFANEPTIFFVFNALLTHKIVTKVYKNRKVRREKKKKRGLSLYIQQGNIIA